MQSTLKKARQTATQDGEQCNSIRMNAAGRALPAKLERAILSFCDLDDLGALLISSKAMRAAVDLHLQLLQALHLTTVYRFSEDARRLVARLCKQSRSLRTLTVRERRREAYDDIDEESREDGLQLIVRLVRANERSLEFVRIESSELEDDDFDRNSESLPSILDMPQIFDAAARCRKLSEFVAPCAANKSLRARHTLILPRFNQRDSKQSAVDFDALFRGA